MELDELNKLEEKVRHLVNNLVQLKSENEKLKVELVQSQKESSLKNEERLEIKKKVSALIDIIDAIEK